MCYVASLSDKTTDNFCGIGNNRTGRYDEILGNYTVANINRGRFITVDGSVIKPGTVFYGRIIANSNITYCTGINNPHLFAYFPTI